MGYSEDFIPDGMNAFERNVKRIGDCIIAGVLLLIFSPLFLICYLVVKREDGGPAIFCQNKDCKFAIWKNNKWWAAKKKQPTKAVVSALLKDGRVRVTGLYSEKTGKTYDAAVVLEDDGQYANFKLEFDQRKGGSR